MKKPAPAYQSIVIRGGRLTKWKGVVASIAPSIGRLMTAVSPPALGLTATLSLAGAMLATPAAAVCVGAAGVYSCDGINNVTQSLANAAGLDVTLQLDFTVTTAAGDALNLIAAAGPVDLVQLGTGSIYGAATGLYAFGSGGVSISTIGPDRWRGGRG